MGIELVAIKYSDGVTPNVSYAYDAVGRRVSMTDGTGSTAYVYDTLNRLTSSTNGAGAVVGYGYDLKGQLTSLAYPSGLGSVTRTYDDAGRLHSVADWLSHSTTFSYDAASHLTGIAYPNTTTASYTYDNAGRLTSISDQQGTNPAFISLTYGRDSIGQLTGDSSATPSTFGYDSLNRQASGPGNLGYTYDAADRITGINVTAGSQGTLAYDNGDQLQTYRIMSGSTQVQKYTYAFDANGNRTSRTDASNNTINYGWDQANRLTSYGTTATYAYNGDGLRMSKTVNSTPEAFTWNVAEGLPLILMDGSTAFVSGPGGLPLEQIAGGSALYAHQDQLGSTVAMTDGAGLVQLTKAYDSYGNVLASTGGGSTPLLYAGQYVDSESGLYYLRARHYDPSTAQFISRDPLTGTTRQPYSYGLDNPLNRTDRSGLDTNGFCQGISGGLGPGGFLQTCLVWDSHGHIGTTSTWGAGGQTPCSALTAGFQHSNGDTNWSLTGPFGYAGFGGAYGLLGGDYTGSVGYDAQGRTVFVNDVDFAGGPGIPVDLHGGYSQTSYDDWGTDIHNAANAVGKARNAVSNWWNSW